MRVCAATGTGGRGRRLSDGRLLVAHNLEAEEAALTGESHAVSKHIGALEGDGLKLDWRLNTRARCRQRPVRLIC